MGIIEISIIFVPYNSPLGATMVRHHVLYPFSSHNLGFIIGCKSSCPSGALLFLCPLAWVSNKLAQLVTIGEDQNKKRPVLRAA